MVYHKDGAARHRAKRIKAGLCRDCPNERTTYKWLCDECMGKWRVKQRQLKGCKPREPGGPGRPIGRGNDR